MKSLIITFCVLSLFVLTANAQNATDKTINKANNSVNSANSSINNADGTATNAVTTATNATDQVKNIGGQLTSLFGKKKAAASNVTKITVAGATYGKLKEILKGIKACDCVEAASSKLVCTATEQSITIAHSGSTNDLIEAIEKKSKLITDDNVSNVVEGSFDVKL